MGEWKQVVSVTEREEYDALLRASNPAYEASNLKGLNKLLDERNGLAYIYTETNLFHLLLIVTPNRENETNWKIVNAMPMGDYDPVAAAKLTFTKIREVMDEVGANSFYGIALKDYGDLKINQYFNCVPDISWEFRAEDEVNAEKFRFTFTRPAERKTEDQQFEGPGKSVEVV